MRKRAQRRSHKIESGRRDRVLSATPSMSVEYSKKHWQTAAFLTAIVLMVMFLTSYFNFTSGIALGDGDTLTGKFYLSGPDPYYNARLIEKTIETGHYPYLGGVYGGLDPLLNYPLGASGGRPPLFNMLTIGVSRFFTPFMDTTQALGYCMQFLPALYGALLVIPVYFIGKTLFNRKTGLIAAFLVPLIPIHIGSGHGSAYSLYDHDSFILLLMTTAFMFLILSLKEEHTKKSFLYAMCSGVFVAAVSLTWVSGQYVYAVIAFCAVTQMIVNILTSKTSTHIVRSTVTPLLVGYVVTFPLYFLKSGFKPDIYFYISIGTVAFAAICLGLGKAKIPWIISIPSLFAVIAAALFFLYTIRGTTNPLLIPLSGLAKTIFGGVYHTKVSLTIAEASTFGISRTIMSFGPALYLLAWISILYLAFWKRVILKQEPAALFISLWFFIESYLTASAGRFLNDLVPLVALSCGAVIWFVFSKIDYRQMIKSMRSSGGLRGVKRAIKVVHIFGIVFIAFLIVLPNAYLSFDAAVPSIEKKKIFGENYGGAFGLDLHTEQYWTDALAWLWEQNKHIENESERPAFISWWDYGFYCVAVADNPTVADNFQDGIPPAGNFHTSESEQEAVAVLIVRVAQGDMAENDGKLSEGVKQVFINHLGVNNSTILVQILEDPIHHENSSYGKVIGEEYGGERYTVREENAMYHDATIFLTSHLDDEGITMLYRDLQLETGKSIRYYGVEGYDINIFNVFTFLSDKGVFGYETSEDDYFKLMYRDKNGDTYTPDEVRNMAENMTQEQLMDLNLKPVVEHKDPFFNSMVYRTYIGHVRKEDFEKYASTGYFYQLLLLNNLYTPTQGLKHFVAEYISPVTNEKPFYFSRARECLGMPAVVIAKYYEGARLNCTVTCMGKPLRVAAAVQKTTVGTPVTVKHDIGFTDSNGSFSLLAPAGNISLLLYLTSERNEHVVKEIVFNSTTNPDYYPIAEEEATRRSNNYTRFLNITVNSSSLSGYVFDDINGNKSYDKDVDTPLPDVHIQLYDLINGGTTFVVTNESGYYNVSGLFSSIYELVATYEGFEIHTNETLFLAPDMNSYDIVKPKPSNVEGIVFYDSNNNAAYDEGEEMEQARVQLIYSNTDSVVETKVTNETGVCRFSSILPGDYRLNVTVFNVSSGAPAYSALENIMLEENTTLKRNISLELARIPVTGYTRYQSGETVGNVTIYFTAALVENNTAESATAESDATGYYRVALKPGVYNISAHVSVTDEETNETTSYSYKGILSLSIGQPPVTAFDITLTREED